MVLQHILCNDKAISSVALWSLRLRTLLETHTDWKIKMQLRDTMTSAEMMPSPGLFVCCVFDFEEQIEVVLRGKTSRTLYVNSHGRSHLHIAAKNGSCATLERLIARHRPNVKLPLEVVKAAADNSRNNKEMMVMLLNRRGADVVITEEVLVTAARNSHNGKEVMALLLDQWGADVVIT
jgi:hypothetical protein